MSPTRHILPAGLASDLFPGSSTAAPTRRIVLGDLAALPIAAVSSTAGETSPDVALIALARRVTRLAVLDDKARLRASEAQDRFEQMKPAPVPDHCQAQITAAWQTEFHAACPADASDDMVQKYAGRAGAAAKAVREQHAALLVTHEEACQHLRQETGLGRAEDVVEWLCDRLRAAVGDLTAAQPLTMQGVAAKASAFVVIQDNWQCRDAWVVDLAESVTRDVERIWGAA